VTEHANPVFEYEMVPSPTPREGVAVTLKVASPYVFDRTVVAKEIVRPELVTVTAPETKTNE
jgi:hypothetical protein